MTYCILVYMYYSEGSLIQTRKIPVPSRVRLFENEIRFINPNMCCIIQKVLNPKMKNGLLFWRFINPKIN